MKAARAARPSLARTPLLLTAMLLSAGASAQGAPPKAAPQATSAQSASPKATAQAASNSGTATSSSAPDQQAKAAAQALFDEAMALRKQGQSESACAKLEESSRLDPAPGAKFYLAECKEQAGKFASAWLLYTEVADAMAATGQQKREQFARERSAALLPKLARLQVAVPEASRIQGLTIRRDGVVLGEPQWGFAVPVDFGSHSIEATAPGVAPYRATVEVRDPGKTVTVEIPTLGAGAAPQLTACAPTSAAAADTAPKPDSLPPPWKSLRTAGFALGGVGILSAAAGAILGSLAISTQNESNRGPCDLARDVCNQKGLALRADALTAATGSTVAFVASGVLVAAGIALVILPVIRPPQPAHTSQVFFGSPHSPQASSYPSNPTSQKVPVHTASLIVRPTGLSLEGRW